MNVNFSTLALTVACPASLQLQAQTPPAPDTDEKLEGNLADWLAEITARGIGPLLPGQDTIEYKGRTLPVSDEMRNGAALFAMITGPGWRFQDPVSATRIHADCHGRPDAWKYTPERRTVSVAEYKYGHRFVSEYENWQLIGGAVGVMERLHLLDHEVSLELTVVQPRAYGHDAVRTWTVPADLIRAHVNIAADAAERALAPNPVAKPGPHCIDCGARHACTALRNGAAAVVDFTGEGSHAELDPTATGHELRAVDAALAILQARRTGLAALAEGFLRGGQRVPFYTMEPGRSALKWTIPVDQLANFGAVTGYSLLKPPAAITPKQAIDSGVPRELVESISTRPPAGLHLAPVNASDVRQVLGT